MPALASTEIKQILPDLREIQYSYDTNGNITSITPPGRPAHTFTYTPVDLEDSYDPPAAGFTPKNTQYTYNRDRQLDLVTRSDGQTLDLVYDTAGRLANLIIPGGQLTYTYDATTGNLSGVTGKRGRSTFLIATPI